MTQVLVKKSQVENVVEALLQLLKKKTEKSVSMIDGGEKIDLQIILTAVPSVRCKFRLELPHSIDEDVREVCLFVKDLDKNDREYEKTVFHYENLFKEKGVTKISKIIPIKALRTDYCLPMNKRTLAKAYDLYLADGKIISFLPGLLGKIFYNRKKTVPVQVNLEKQDLKEHLDTAINNPEYEISAAGTTSSVQIGHDNMSKKELVDNTMEAIRVFADKVPGGKDNLKRISVRCTNKHILPLYFNLVDPKSIKLPERKEEIKSYIDELTTLEDGLVHVRADGYVKIVKRKRKSENNTKDIEEKKPKIEVKEEPEVLVDSNSKKGKKSKSKKEKSKQMTAKKEKVKKGKGKKKDVGDTSVIEIKEEEDEIVEKVEVKEEVDIEEDTKDDVKDKIQNKKKNKKNMKGKQNDNDVKQKKNALKQLKQTKAKKIKKGK